MAEFRRRGESVIRSVQRGERWVLTYRGERVLRLEPLPALDVDESDPFYSLTKLADDGAEDISNEDIDAIVYGA